MKSLGSMNPFELEKPGNLAQIQSRATTLAISEHLEELLMKSDLQDSATQQSSLHEQNQSLGQKSLAFSKHKSELSGTEELQRPLLSYGNNCHETSDSRASEINTYKKRWSIEEDQKMLQLFYKHGRNWELIASSLNKRTPGSAKNRFYSILKKNIPKEDRVALVGRSSIPMSLDLEIYNLMKSQQQEEKVIESFLSGFEASETSEYIGNDIQIESMTFEEKLEEINKLKLRVRKLEKYCKLLEFRIKYHKSSLE